MKRTAFAILVVILGAALAWVAFHRRRGDDRETVRAALETYLSKKTNLNLAGMDMNVTQLKINGDAAEAQVEFRAKQGGGAMQMTYQLERQANGWMVKGVHGMGGGHPAIEEEAPETPSPRLPPGHPPVGGGMAAPTKPAAPPAKP